METFVCGDDEDVSKKLAFARLLLRKIQAVVDQMLSCDETECEWTPADGSVPVADVGHRWWRPRRSPLEEEDDVDEEADEVDDEPLLVSESVPPITLSGWTPPGCMVFLTFKCSPHSR